MNVPFKCGIPHIQTAPNITLYTVHVNKNKKKKVRTSYYISMACPNMAMLSDDTLLLPD